MKPIIANLIIPLFCIIFVLPIRSVAQNYFGKNKVQYEDLDFRIYETPHFDIYNYLEDERQLNKLAQMSERWYKRHQDIFQDSIIEKNPMIIYNNHADFKQTTVLQQRISVGLGGATEGLRTRVIMPVTISNKETSHVLGHEMVHVFQYRMAKSYRGINIRTLNRMPMWMIEGLPEYMTLGAHDTHTAIWMRDRVAMDEIPSVEDLSKNPREYFPYRYGHALWAYLTGKYGDKMIKTLQILTVKNGLDSAFSELFGIKPDSVSNLWANDLKETYTPFMQDTIATVGTEFIDVSGKSNLIHSPVISPDGKYITFISDRNVISIDVYLANLETGKIEKRLTSAIRKSYIDDYSYLESAGSFSPDSKKYVLTTFKGGRNALSIIDLENFNTERNIALPGVEAFQNPTWSPEGRYIAVTGMSQGYSDLYLYDLEKDTVRRLTDDAYSDIQPDFGPDGDRIVFSTDRGTSETDLELFEYGDYRIAVYDLNTDEVTTLEFFEGANNISPQFSVDGESVFFLSNSDGFRNMYEYEFKTGNVYKRTQYYTGIIGVTEYSPVLSVNGNENQIAYTLYKDGKYHLYYANESEFPEYQVDPDDVDLSASILPPVDRVPLGTIISQNLNELHLISPERFSKEPFDPRFKLEFVGSSGIGVGASQFGTALAGGVSLLFSDILKQHMLYSTVRVSGQVEDIGGQVSYINRDQRLNWGTSFSHIPYRTQGSFLTRDTINIEDGDSAAVLNLTQIVQRTFEDRLTLFTQYPFSVNLRLEGGMSMARYSYSLDSIANLYTPGGVKFAENEFSLPTPDPRYIGSAYIAYVGDNSKMGLTSPLMGNRYRFEVQRYFKSLNVWSFLGDYRKYWFAPPLSFAVRGMFIGRYGEDNDILFPLFIGNNFFVRGYTVRSFQRNNCPDEDCLNINQLVGSKIGVANAEIRFPFSGPERLTLIKSGFLFTDLVLFTDAGIAWDDPDNLDLSWDPTKANDRIPVVSSGVALRLNLFGYFVLEPYLAFPYQRKNVSTVFNLWISAGGW